MVIKGIIFDFGFTLFHFINPSVKRYYECYKNGLVKSIEILKEKQIWNEKLSHESFFEKLTKRRQNLFKESIKTKIEFPTSMIFKIVLESLRKEEIISNLEHIDNNTYDKLAELYHSCEEDEWEPFKNTRETLETLTEMKLKLALISNHPNHKTIINMLQRYNLANFLNPIMTSARFGKRKPDPSIFLHTIEKMGLKNQNKSIIMCGDEYADIIGAQRANIQSILFERKYKFPFEKEINITNLGKISDISEILNFID